MPMKSIPAMISREFTKIQNDPDFIMPLVIDETGISPELILNLGFAKPDQYRLDDLIGNLKRQGFELVLQEHNLSMFVVTQKGYEAAKGEDRKSVVQGKSV